MTRHRQKTRAHSLRQKKRGCFEEKERETAVPCTDGAKNGADGRRRDTKNAPIGESSPLIAREFFDCHNIAIKLGSELEKVEGLKILR